MGKIKRTEKPQRSTQELSVGTLSLEGAGGGDSATRACQELETWKRTAATARLTGQRGSGDGLGASKCSDLTLLKPSSLLVPALAGDKVKGQTPRSGVGEKISTKLLLMTY